MARKKGLGKGLDALLHSMNMPELSAKQEESMSTDVIEEEPKSKPAKEQKTRQLVDKETTQGSPEAPIVESTPNGLSISYLPIEYLARGEYQPRRDIDPDSLEELASSIKVRGVIQPLVVRPIGVGQKSFEIVAGERRWRASQIAGLDKVPCVVKPMADEAALAIALIENIQREDLNPIEEARALYRLQEEFKLTHQQIADAVGKSRTTITNVLRLNALSEELKRLVENGDLEVGHAKALLVLPESKQLEVSSIIVAKQLSVRQAESLVRQMQLNDKSKKTGQISVDPNVRKLQDDLADKLGALVSITHTAKGKGKLVVKFNSLDELDGILNHIQ